MLNYKQYKLILRENDDMPLQIMMFGEQWPTVAEITASPLDKWIIIDSNDCGYGGKTKELIVNYVHPLFLKAKSAASR